MRKHYLVGLLGAGLLAFRPAGPTPPAEALKAQAVLDLQAHYTDYRQLAQRIWGFAEVGYKET